MPLVFKSFDFSDYDLVISVTSESAKGIRTKGKTKHICYCLTPTRYLWSGYDQYFTWLPLKISGWPAVKILRIWDKKAASLPDVMVAISSEVQKRIKKYYGRKSPVIFPPVEINHQSSIINHQSREYYLLVSRLDYGYKKVDLAIEAFNKLDLPLVIVGTGREESKLRRLAGKNIIFAGRVNEKKLREYYMGAKALIMPQEEDFGIVSVEAQSYGVPVIAYKKGGAIDTVIPGKTGIFFEKQNPEKLIEAVNKFEKMNFGKMNFLKNVRRFSKSRFKKEFLDLTEKVLN
jgi:glycosyltransferase involved in cell wall biosynthesis